MYNTPFCSLATYVSVEGNFAMVKHTHLHITRMMTTVTSTMMTPAMPAARPVMRPGKEQTSHIVFI